MIPAPLGIKFTFQAGKQGNGKEKNAKRKREVMLLSPKKPEISQGVGYEDRDCHLYHGSTSDGGL